MPDEPPKLPQMRRLGHVGGKPLGWSQVQLTHKPTGQVATVSLPNDRPTSLAVKARLALSILRGRLVYSTTPTRRVRNYDLTPGVERIKGGGIDTADVAAVLDRGELPPPRRDDGTK